MKITTVINAQGLNPASGIGRKASPGSSRSAPNTAAADQSRRFDTFTMIGTEKSETSEKPAENLSAAKEKLIRKLSTVSEEDKASIAFSSYIEMKKSLLNSKGYVQGQVHSFNLLKEHQAYYTELEANGGLIEGEGKYAFSEMQDGDIADLDAIAKEQGKISQHLDVLCGKIEGKGDEAYCLLGENSVMGFFISHNLYEKMFAADAAVFSAVTGISDSALEIAKGDLNFDKTDVDEDNFLQKANEFIDSIEAREKAITDIWTQYTYDNLFAKEKAMNPNDTLQEVRDMKGTSLSKIISEFERCIMMNY